MHLPSDFDDTGDPHPTGLAIQNSHSDTTIDPTPDHVPNPESETVKSTIESGTDQSPVR